MALSRSAFSWSSRNVKRSFVLALIATVNANFFVSLVLHNSSQSISNHETSKLYLQSFGKIDAFAINSDHDLKSLSNDTIVKPVDNTKQQRLTNFVPRKDEVPTITLSLLLTSRQSGFTGSFLIQAYGLISFLFSVVKREGSKAFGLSHNVDNRWAAPGEMLTI